ncbi:ABC transporter substrate-binding protein [Methylomonas montana]|uniref:ABC transporter substrate-binding protein n=1 Tax=Methylomonas montana TaxID=3058963 RepID=UPI00265AFEB1|nr:ABC transporter substrate-binding protein [Methylomonas montana]WKJ88671.1 ABC transporter substrate-binding protein [Methylomonas montana]
MRQLIHRMVLAVFTMTLVSCEPAPKVARQSAILGISKQPTSVLFFIAQAQKLFEKHGLNVELKIYPSGKRALDEGLLSGIVDMTNPFDTPVALAVFTHPELRVLASTIRADNVSFIVARRDRGIIQESDLRGRSIATQEGSAVHFFLYQFLLEHNLSYADVALKFDKIEALPELLNSGQVDAVSVREPYLSQCLEKLGERVTVFADPGIYEQSELLVTTEKLLREKPGVAHAVLAALLEAENHVQPVEATAAIVAQHLDMTRNQAIDVLNNYHTRVEMRHSLLLLLEEVARWGINSGLVQGAVPDYLDVLAPEALSELAPDRVSIIR